MQGHKKRHTHPHTHKYNTYNFWQATNRAEVKEAGGEGAEAGAGVGQFEFTLLLC